MSDQRKKANEFMRKKLGAEVDAAAGSAGFRVIKGDGEGDEESSMPWIELPTIGRQVREFAKEIGAVAAEQNVFRRDNIPVTVDDETGAVGVITSEEFCTLVEEWCVTYKLVPKKGGYDNEPTTMTKETASKTLKARPFIQALRKLERVNLVRMPVYRGAEPVLLPEGYDDETRTYTLKSRVKINEALKPEEGATILRDYQAEFPFHDARSMSVAIAGMVAMFVSQMQELTANRMGFVYRSNVEGAGKSLQAACALSPCYGLVKGQPLAGREELRKLLDATALSGLPYIFLDNLTGHVASELLDAYMTTPIWTGRVMGTNTKIFEAPANAMLFITGNGITVSPDIARRSLVCNLRVVDADPELRQPKRVMTPQYLARPEVRGDMLSALWALVRGWKEKKCPPAARRVRSFEEWSDLVGGIVLAAGFGDPLERPKDEESPEPKNVDKRRMVEQLVVMMPAERRVCEFTFEEIVDVCREHECFDWLIDGKMVKKREKLDDGSYDESEHFEPTKQCRSALAKIFAVEMADQEFVLKSGLRVKFRKHGKQRHRKYQLERMDGAGAAGELPLAGGAA